MKKLNTSPLSGTQELLPNLQSAFDHYKSGIASAFYAHGFQRIETPTIDRTEILLAKAGGDTEKQIYKVIKTEETASDADQALRFDHTVPLARYVVEHSNDLAFPFKVTQIGRNFRGERAQKGRFREFYQCDVDVIGWQTLPLAYDADVILTLLDALSVLPLGTLKLRVSNRKLLTGMLAELNLDHRSAEIFSIVDHAEKMPREKTVAAIADLGIGSEQQTRLLDFMDIHGPRQEVIEKLRAFGFQNPTFEQGITELDEVLASVERQLSNAPQTSSEPQPSGAPQAPSYSSDPQLLHASQTSAPRSVEIVADMLIVRGLDYYTGTVFEAVSTDHPGIGSICGGGRYENLASHYTDQLLPGVGGSIGLTRLFYILSEYNLLDVSTLKSTDFCLIPLSANELPAAETLAAKLRTSGKSVNLVLTDRKLGDKLTYAAKIANFAIVIGESEVQTGSYMVKNLATGETAPLQ